jgi:hypothetical protein
VRLEAYRVTLYCADLEPQQAWLAAGAHTLEVRPSDQQRRKVVRERAEPVPGGAVATYALAGRRVTLAFDDARIPLLGNEPPVEVVTKLGPVALDAWDPDTPLHLRGKDDAREAEARGEPGRDGPAPEGPFADVEVEIRRRDQPVFGAGVWVEDAACKRAADGSLGAAISDAQGKATLRGLPHGAWRVLVRDLQHGTKEILVNVPPREPVVVAFGRREEDAPEPRTPLPSGTILLDLGEIAAGAHERGAEVGLLGPDARLARKLFDERSRFVRIEGLVPGPTSFYVQVGKDAPVFLGGLLTQGDRDPPVVVPEVEKRTYRMHVRDSQGRPLEAVRLSLGEVTRVASRSGRRACCRCRRARARARSRSRRGCSGTSGSRCTARTESGSTRCSPALRRCSTCGCRPRRPSPRVQPHARGGDAGSRPGISALASSPAPAPAHRAAWTHIYSSRPRRASARPRSRRCSTPISIPRPRSDARPPGSRPRPCSACASARGSSARPRHGSGPHRLSACACSRPRTRPTPSACATAPLRPLVLFAKGDLALLASRSPSLALVGSRTPTPYGVAAAEDFAARLAAAGVVLWSGLAYGIDAIAHRQALAAGTPTVAVLAGGLDVVYPALHAELAEQVVARGGLLLAEAPPGQRATRGHFRAATASSRPPRAACSCSRRASRRAR